MSEEPTTTEPAKPKAPKSIRPAKMVMRNRNFVLSSTRGHCVEFIKGQETLVPRAVLADALAAGAELVDEDASEAVAEDEGFIAPSLAEDRNVAILEAIKTIVEENDSRNFTGSGAPKAAAVTRLVNFDASNKEVVAVFKKFRDEEAKAAEQDALDVRVGS